jgi:hypothetical protein
MRRLIQFVLLLGFCVPAFAAGGTCPTGNQTIQWDGTPSTIANVGVQGAITGGVTSCFYISKSTGADTNNGTSESTPWAHAPGMPSCTNTCASTTPAAGEGFIFRGGETWTSSDLGINLNISGSSTHPIYYGVDQTWFNSSVCGASWCRPILNAGSAVSSNMWQFNGSNSWVIVDNFEMIGMRNNQNGFLDQFATNMRATQMYMHGWTHTGTTNNVGIISEQWTGSSFDHNVMDGSDSIITGPTGSCTVSQCGTFNGVDSQNGGSIAYNYFAYVVSAVLSTTDVVHDNVIVHTITSVDGDHCNALFSQGPATTSNQIIYNNYINNGNSCSGGVVLWFNGNVGSPNPSSIGYGFNNVMWGLSSNPVNIGNHGAGNYGTYWWFNNTVDCTLGGCGGTPPTGPLWTINLGNNHYIPSALNFACSGCTVNSIGTDLVQTESVANGQGYTSTETFPYSPISSCTTGTCSTLQAGTNDQSVCTTLAGINAAAGAACQNGTSVACAYSTSNHTLSCPNLALNARPASAAWDAGAYQFVSGGTPPANPPVFTPGAGTYTSTQTVTASNPSTAPTGCFTVNGSTPATNGTTGCTTGALYFSSISVATSEAVKMVWGGTGFTDSSVTSAAYVIAPVISTPTASPVAGTYTGTQTVTLTTSTGGSILCYTTNGATPAATTAGTCSTGNTLTNGGSVVVSATSTINVLGTQVEFTNSSVGSYAYTINSPTGPTVTTFGGTGTIGQTISH